MDLSPEKYREDMEIIRETAQQVIRDFSIHKKEIIFSGNETTAYQELVGQLDPVLSEMYTNDKHTFQAMLYQIDISERSFRELLSTTDKKDFSFRLAEMIVRREFQKVLTRRFFRNG